MGNKSKIKESLKEEVTPVVVKHRLQTSIVRNMLSKLYSFQTHEYVHVPEESGKSFVLT